jgi:hypothetical protein
MIKKFGQTDVFVNTVKTLPRFKFSIYNGEANYRGDFGNTVAKGYAALNDLNKATTEIANPNYYKYMIYDGYITTFGNVTADNISTARFGDIFQINYPISSSISTFFFPNINNAISYQYSNDDENRYRLNALKTTFNKYKIYSSLFNYSSSYFDCATSDIGLVNIPNLFYGQQINKGSVKLSIYSDGVLLCRAEDTGRNGELVQTTGSTTLNDKNVAGLVFYDEGLILLFSSAQLASYQEQFYSTPDNYPTTPDYPRWNTWGLPLNSEPGSVTKTSYDIEFEGINKIPQLLMFAHADVGELNNSNNKTFIQSGQTNTSYITSSNGVTENQEIQIKNIVKTPYISPVPTFHKETYISKILIYDDKKNVIGIAKLATPVRKTEDRSFTFKLKLNL